MTESIGRSAMELGAAELEQPDQKQTEPLLSDRIERVISALLAPGGAVLLLGEQGSGKNRLAEEAAYALDERLGGVVVVRILPSPHPVNEDNEDKFEDQFLQHFGVSSSKHHSLTPAPKTSELSELMLKNIAHDLKDRNMVVIAPAVDVYPPRVGLLLTALARSKSVRLVATARRLSGAAELMSRDPRVHRLSIGPLTYHEARVMLTDLLRCEQIEFSTLHRWYAITNGNAHTLTVLALALDRLGLIINDKGMVWEKTHSSGTIPEEFLTYLEETCSVEEILTLEIIALAEPLTESVLIERLVPEHLQALQLRGLIVTRVLIGGKTALATSHELLASALKARISTKRRKMISQDLYMTLRHDGEGQEPERIIRQVLFGLEAGRTLPVELLSTALKSPSFERDPETKLSIALAIARHPDSFGARLAEATISICHTARLIGNRNAVTEGIEIIHEFSGNAEAMRACTTSQRIRLRLELVAHLTLDLEQYEAAATVLSDLSQQGYEAGSSAYEMVRCARAVFYARTGLLRRAEAIGPGADEEGRMQIEWVRSQARLIMSLIFTQQGQFTQAIESAEKARTFAVLGTRAERFTADGLTLAVFVAQWASGAILSANETILRVQNQSLSHLQDTGFVEAGLSILALSEGRWREAAQGASRALHRFIDRDPFGIATLISGVLAYAQAALGERANSRQAVLTAETPRPGTSHMLLGIVRILTLEARLWNDEPDVVEYAYKTIAWANAESLPFVELRAFQVLASEQGFLDVANLVRARKVALEVDEPMGSALIGFLEEVNAGESKWDCPSGRMLADLGVWIPLPRTPKLSSREREIALHAALGYSSRWIAERFFLSSRTVETHLRHVFTKLGVTGRDELRSSLRNGQFLHNTR